MLGASGATSDAVLGLILVDFCDRSMLRGAIGLCLLVMGDLLALLVLRLGALRVKLPALPLRHDPMTELYP